MNITDHYQVEIVNPPSEAKPGKMAYHLTGPRGTYYGLMRCMPKPHCMFAINRFGRPCAIRGYEWFTDKDGVLRPYG